MALLYGCEVMLDVDIGGVILTITRPPDSHNVDDDRMWIIHVYAIAVKHHMLLSYIPPSYGIQLLLIYGGEVERMWCQRNYPEYCTEEFLRKDASLLEYFDMKRFDYGGGDE